LGSNPQVRARLERAAAAYNFRNSNDNDNGQTSAVLPDGPTASLSDVLDVFHRYLRIADSFVYALLGAVAANRLQGDPVWLIVVGPPGSGKTEVLQSASGLPWVHAVATITVPGLLSGSGKRERASDAHGGLLRQVGEFGVVCCKDFGSVLSMHRDARSEVLAALREIYDGSWQRHIGSDGGRTLSWNGKCGLIGACTQHLDRHHAVMNSMGERFLSYRLRSEDPGATAECALRHAGRETLMRRELREVVTALFRGFTAESAGNDDPALREWIVKLATLTARCRSAVERDGYSREVELIPDAEVPTRLALQLERLYAGMIAIGVAPATASETLRKVALDCLPQIRRRTLELLASVQEPLGTEKVAERLGYPTSTTRRSLEDLAAHAVVSRNARGGGKSDTWAMSVAIAGLWSEIATVPEKSVPIYIPDTTLEDFSGKLPANGEISRRHDVVDGHNGKPMPDWLEPDFDDDDPDLEAIEDELRQSARKCSKCDGEGCRWCS
jgi:hypothetical protein